MRIADLPSVLGPTWTHRIAAWFGMTYVLHAFPCCDDHPDPWGPADE